MSSSRRDNKAIDRDDSANPRATESFSAEDIETMAISRVASALAESPPPEALTTIGDVLSHRIWPFYAGWLHEPFGPCGLGAIFGGDEAPDGTAIDTVWIIITTICPPPADRIFSIVEKHTFSLILDKFKDRIELKVGQGTITRSAPPGMRLDDASTSNE